MKKLATGLFVLGTLLSAVPVTAFAEDHDPDRNVEYVALGDSIAAGMTPYGTYDKSYPDFIKNYLDRGTNEVVDYNNFAVSGYTSEQLKNDLLNNEEIRNEISEATHVTINIGANDLFKKLIADPYTAYEGITSASTNLQAILSTIDELNPDADVYVMGYYNPFAYYPEQAQGFLVPLSDALNAEIEKRVAENGDTYVPTSNVIDPHFEKYMPNPEDNHLNVKGYKVIAKEFWKVMNR